MVAAASVLCPTSMSNLDVQMASDGAARGSLASCPPGGPLALTVALTSADWLLVPVAHGHVLGTVSWSPGSTKRLFWGTAAVLAAVHGSGEATDPIQERRRCQP